MAIEEEEELGVPEWVVTFGDMMSLLLTFFIMLVSMSEIKEEERFQSMLESFRKQFGHDSTDLSLAPGSSKPRNSQLFKLATMGRAKRFNTMKGGDKVSAPVGDHPQVRLIRPGGRTTVGTSITFIEFQVELTEKHKRELQQQANSFGGKPQKIEVTGHTSRKPLPPSLESFRDKYDIAYERCRNVKSFLVELGIEEKRIVLRPVADSEPFHIGTDPEKLKLNPRVDVYLLDSIVTDFEGTTEEKEGFYIEE